MLLRCIYGKIPRFVTSCHGFLRILTSILRNITVHRSFYVLVTTCLRVVTNSYELVTSISESLRFFAKKYINPANLNVSLFDNKWYKHLLRVIYGFLRAVNDRYVLLRALYDTYGLSRVIYGKINPWTIVRRFLTCQKMCLSFHGSLTVSASCCGL